MTQTKRPLPALYIGVVMFAVGLLVATLLHTGPFSRHGTPSPSTTTPAELFRLDGQPVGIADLPYLYAAELHELELRAGERRIEILREAALDRHLKALAAEQGKPLAEVRAGLLGDLTVSETEIERFFNQNQARIGRPLFEVRDAIANALRTEKESTIHRDLILGLEKQGRLEIARPQSSAPLATFELAGLPDAGNPQAQVTVVEFFDYRCSHCRTASTTLRKLIDAHPDRLRWVPIDFPLLGGVSRQLAMGSYCAQQQNRYWDYHHEVFASHERLHAGSPSAIAEKLTLDKSAFDSCLSGTAAAAYVDATQQQGLEVGVKGTPTIFINGLEYQNGSLEEDLTKAIEQAIGQP